MLGKSFHLALPALLATLAPLAMARGAVMDPPQSAFAAARHFHGQTFVVWNEVGAIAEESYRVYRHDQPIDAVSIDDATLLYEVWEGSSAYWSDHYFEESTQSFEPRFTERMLFPPPSGNVGVPIGPTTGLLVWTLRPEDFSASTDYWYAVTTVSSLGVENRSSFAGNTVGPITGEAVEDPQPLKLETTVGPNGLLRHVYLQYMDLREFNPTLTAPNAVYKSYGLNLTLPHVANNIQYAFSYVVLEPTAAGPLPVVLKLHPYAFDNVGPGAFTEVSTGTLGASYYDYDAIEIRPIDMGSTWWFGFADETFDYRQYADACDAIEGMTTASPPPAIANYTEARVLRMVYDLLRDPYDLAGRTDPERVYVCGWSMGGAGTLAMALRYPHVFAAAHATAPVTDFAHLVDPDEICPNPSLMWPGDPECFLGFQLDLAFNVAAKWGPPGSGPNRFDHVYPGVCSFQNPAGHVQPVRLRGPAGLADHLSVHDGTPVYEWQDMRRRFEELGADDVAPLSLRHSSIDRIANWDFQGQPMYTAINDAGVPWGGLIDDALDHLAYWFLGMPPNYAVQPGVGPFFGLQAVLSETVPGLTLVPRRKSEWIFPPPAIGFHQYNAETGFGFVLGSALEWSSSWNDWDGPPTDLPEEWGVSLRVSTGLREVVDVVPRRTQQFEVVPGELYSYSVFDLQDQLIDCGCLLADYDGKLVVREVIVGRRGVRLRIRRGPDPTCGPCGQFAAIETPDGGSIGNR